MMNLATRKVLTRPRVEAPAESSRAASSEKGVRRSFAAAENASRAPDGIPGSVARASRRRVSARRSASTWVSNSSSSILRVADRAVAASNSGVKSLNGIVFGFGSDQKELNFVRTVSFSSPTEAEADLAPDSPRPPSFSSAYCASLRRSCLKTGSSASFAKLLRIASHAPDSHT